MCENKYVPFAPADILIPKTGHEKWAVVACDQFTSELDYWKRVEDIVSGGDSAFSIMLPEIFLEDDLQVRIKNINENMKQYLDDGIFDEYDEAMIFVERTLPDGKIRYGIVGAVDLDEYDYSSGATAMIRATEGTVLERIPPRMRIRENAPLEMPHVMLLIDDPERSVIEPLKGEDMEIVYDFELMMNGGRLRGKLIDKVNQAKIIKALSGLSGDEVSPLLFAVGDGNHSLATAKACYEANKETLSKFALVEVVNIHDEALEFEPIYRVMFNVNIDDIISEMNKYFTADPNGQRIEYITADKDETITVEAFSALPVGTLQNFIDDYMKANPDVKIDYIHGIDVVKKLAAEPNTIGFVFDGMEKAELFPSVIQDGALPRKTFSMGEAASKRYYMECRKIK